MRVGRVAEEQVLDRRRLRLTFAPDSVFAFIRWVANDYGAAMSRIDPADVAPDPWRHVRNRMAAKDTPRAYTVHHHDAWLARQGAVQ